MALWLTLRWKLSERLFGATALVLVLFCVGGAVASIVREGLSANAAAWIQAAGSIAAVAGAAWLLRAEARHQRRTRRQEREEVAWGVRFALVQAKTECNAIAWEIVGPDAAPEASDLRHWRLRTEVARSLLRSFATRTDHLHPLVAHVANNGVILLSQLDDDLEKVCFCLSTNAPVPEQLTNDITWYVGHFDQLVQTLDERMRGIMSALDQGNDMLPVRDFEGWCRPMQATPPERDSSP